VAAGTEAMTSRARWIAGVALALAAGCSKKPAPSEGGWTPDPVPEPGEVVFTVTPAKKTVPLGAEIALACKVENRSTVAAKVNEPALSSLSVSFKVRVPGVADAAWLERMLVRETPNDAIGLTPVVKELKPGTSVEKEIRVVAVAAGKWTLTPVYRCAALPPITAAPSGKWTLTPVYRCAALPPITAAPFDVEVAAEKPGDRLGFKMETTHGTVGAAFRPDAAFNTCESFASLVRKGFFDGLPFHRVVKGFMAQGGAPGGQGWNGPGYQIKRELSGGRLPHRRGVFSMARRGDPHVHTAGSQFFLCFAPLANLDAGGYATFAEMVEGEDALAKIESLGTDGMRTEAPTEPVSVRKAWLQVFGK
jgi:peptidyl-prolyl cis-trans isomerase B (cyclophilin B)